MNLLECPNIDFFGKERHEEIISGGGRGCTCCNGENLITPLRVLKYRLRGLLVLIDDEPYSDAPDELMHQRIETFIDCFKKEFNLEFSSSFQKIKLGEPISTLNACIETLIITF